MLEDFLIDSINWELKTNHCRRWDRLSRYTWRLEDGTRKIELNPEEENFTYKEFDKGSLKLEVNIPYLNKLQDLRAPNGDHFEKILKGFTTLDWKIFNDKIIGPYAKTSLGTEVPLQISIEFEEDKYYFLVSSESNFLGVKFKCDSDFREIVDYSTIRKELEKAVYSWIESYQNSLKKDAFCLNNQISFLDQILVQLNG